MSAGRQGRAGVAATIREEVILAIATLSGDFDAQVKELQTLKRELDEREHASKTIGDAEALLKSAKDYEAGVMAKAAEYDAKFKSLSENVAKQETLINAAMNDLKQRELALTTGLAEFNDKVKDFSTSVAVTESALNERAAKLAKGEADLAARIAEVTDLKTRLTKSVESLKTA